MPTYNSTFIINDHIITILNDKESEITQGIVTAFTKKQKGLHNVSSMLFRGWLQYPYILHTHPIEANDQKPISNAVLFLVHPSDFKNRMKEFETQFSRTIFANDLSNSKIIIVDVNNFTNNAVFYLAKKHGCPYFQIDTQGSNGIISLFTYAIEYAQCDKAYRKYWHLDGNIISEHIYRDISANPFESLVKRFCWLPVLCAGNKETQLRKFAEFYHAVKNKHPSQQHQMAIKFINYHIEPLRRKPLGLLSEILHLNEDIFFDPFVQMINFKPDQFLNYFNSFQGWLNKIRGQADTPERIGNKILLKAFNLPFFNDEKRGIYLNRGTTIIGTKRYSKQNH